MPWTSATVPEHIKSLPARTQRQWLHVANGCMSDGGDDAACIRMANGVVKKSKAWDEPLTPDEAAAVEGDKYYQYVESWDYTDRAISQTAAGYDPLGATGGKGCANCQWYIPPGRCAVVAGAISPTGLSNLWRATEVYVAEPIPVTIVDSPASPTEAAMADKALSDANGAASDTDGSSRRGLGERLLAAVSQVIPGLTPTQPQRSARGVIAGESVAPRLVLSRRDDGTLRFITFWSNNFEDREKEIFPEYAHKEFVDWSNETKEYPELWLWHTPGTAYGKVDWMDMTDGFVCASGYIYKGKEALAQQIAQEDSGVSHGFYGLQRGKEVAWYRAYELSTLPRKNAAVWTTSFNLLGGDKEMAFTQARKDFLKTHGVTDEQIATFEKSAGELSATLKSLGVEYKDSSLEPEPDPAPADAAAAAAAPTTTAVVDTKAVAEFQTTVLTALQQQTEAMAAMAKGLVQIDARVKSVEKTDDEKIAAAIAPKGAGATAAAVAASKDDGNIVDVKQNDANADFFKGTFLAPLIGTGAASAAPAA